MAVVEAEGINAADEEAVATADVMQLLGWLGLRLMRAADAAAVVMAGAAGARASTF